MMYLTHDHFALDNFEGSLDFLLCLLQKQEVDIYDITLQSITRQFYAKFHEWTMHYLEKGGEGIDILSYLIWLKSKKLLPSENEENAEEVEDIQFEIIHHLVDYCRFKQLGKELTHRQQKQELYYYRNIPFTESKRPLGISHLSLEELQLVFSQITLLHTEQKQEIQEEEYRVSDTISFLSKQLKQTPFFSFMELFSGDKSRIEMVVIFLAILELIKEGKIYVGKDEIANQLFIYPSTAEKKSLCHK
jgi:segregation and condensation protein A